MVDFHRLGHDCKLYGTKLNGENANFSFNVRKQSEKLGFELYF